MLTANLSEFGKVKEADSIPEKKPEEEKTEEKKEEKEEIKESKTEKEPVQPSQPNEQEKPVEKPPERKIDSAQTKRDRLMFSNMLGYLKKAKTRLEREKPHVTLALNNDQLEQQSLLQEKVTAELKMGDISLIEKQADDFGKRKLEQIQLKRELDRKIFRLNEEIAVRIYSEVQNQKIVEHYGRLKSGFIKTK